MQPVKCWSHVSRAEIKDPRNVPYAQKAGFSPIVFTSLLVSGSPLPRQSSTFLFFGIMAFTTIICAFSHLVYRWIINIQKGNRYTWQVCHIKKLIKQHDHYTDAPCAEDNKSPWKTQHYATVFEGACIWLADCRNVLQCSCQRIARSNL